MSPSSNQRGVWLAAGLRTPFAKVDGTLSELDAIELSVVRRKNAAGTIVSSLMRCYVPY